MPSSLVRFSSACLLLFALAACGEREFEPVVAVEEKPEPLPAPLPAAGPVTAIPGGAGPDAIAARGAATSTDATGPAALGVITPVPGQAPAGDADPAGVATASDGSGAAIAFAEGPLPPLEDNPETGLGAPPTPPSGPANPSASGEEDAVAAVSAYYDALRRGDLARAYAAWSDGGRASGRTPEQFAAGMGDLAIASVSLGEPGRVEGAAGSRYVEVPVTVTSRGSDGREVRQIGSFTMRSSQVEGASRGWHIASAELRELQP
ncbi:MULTISPECIES: hypothetical protein [unclassified Luteimonas]